MREFTLLISGLLWPADSLAAACRGLHLPALEAMLAHAAANTSPPATLEVALARLYGIPTDSAPYAALRVAASGSEPGDASWICADPVHLRFARETLVLTDNHELELTSDEASELLAALNDNFADIGEFTLASPGEWNLRLKRSPQVVTHPVAQVLGRNIEPFLPSGTDGAEWRRMINEMQMLLHMHPVNQARDAAGRPVINSVWLWGAGSQPAGIAARYAVVFADAMLARGLARLSGSPCKTLPASLPRSFADTALAVLEGLQYPALALDSEAWRAELKRLESSWFQPLLNALKSRQLTRVSLCLIGDSASIDLQCRHDGWWKFWRRPLPLETFIRRTAAS